MTSMVELKNALMVTRDTYKSKYKQAKQEKNARIKDAKQKFINRQLDEELQKINADFDDSVSKLREEATNYALPLFQDLKKQETSKVAKFDLDRVNKLLAISGLPISTREAVLLANEYGGKDYVSDKVLLNILENNHIPSYTESFAHLNKNIDNKLEIIEDLETQFCDLLNYADDENYRHEILLSDDRLESALRDFNNGVVVENEDAMQTAINELKEIGAGESSIEQAFRVRNLYNGSSAETKQAIQSLLSEHKYLNPLTFETTAIQRIMADVEQES